ncbi:MAG TPA: DoxX family protein [Pseudonocardia sp.]|nr:DoxX family protein [Pseudonocardia sp.]
MDTVALVGRVLFSLLFVGAAFGHFKDRVAMTEYAKSKKLPMAQVAVLGSGVVVLLGGLSVMLGVWPDLGSLVLCAFLVVSAVLFHNFWAQSDAATKQIDQVMFMKNIALAGAALVLYTGFIGESLGATLTDPLFF